MTDDLLPVGAKIGRYTVEGVLGQGGMAAVYKVRHEQLNTLHALKMLTVPGRRIRKRLVQEGKVQAALRHPNIVSVIDILEHENQPGLVMEYVDGPTLEELLESRRLQWGEIDLLGRGILRGVQGAHAQGLIHRDLKPANVLIAVHDDALVPKVTDFGLAKLQRQQTSGHTRSGDTMGTPAYMAPEAIKNAKNVDHRADVFSLGALLYELVTGERCFKGNDILETFTAVVHADHVPVRTMRPDVPERMEAAIEGALRPDPDDRIQDVRVLVETWSDIPHLDPSTTLVPSYTPELVNRVKSMGGGRESLSQVLSEQQTEAVPRSPQLQSMDSRPESTETYLPPDAAVATMLEVFEPVEAPAALAPEEPPSAPAPPSRLPWVGAGLATVGALTALLVLLSLSAAGGMWWWTQPASEVANDIVALPSAVEPLPAPTPASEPDVPTEDPPSVPPTPTAAPAPPPTPVPPPTTPEPEAAPAPSPSPVDEPEPATVDAGAPEPEGQADETPADQARVEVVGDVRILLRRDGGGAFPPGPVPPGTYTVAAFFDPQAPVTVRAGVELVAGQTLKLRCAKELNTCR